MLYTYIQVHMRSWYLPTLRMQMSQTDKYESAQSLAKYTVKSL